MKLNKRQFIKVIFHSIFSLVFLNFLSLNINSRKFLKKKNKIWILNTDDIK